MPSLSSRHGRQPFLLGELAREVAAEGIEPVAANAARPLALEPQGVSRVVLLRLARLPGHARKLAHAVAVLDDGAEPRDAAELAELAAEPLAEAHFQLVRAEILEGQDESLHFVHPIVKNTLYRDLEPLQPDARMQAPPASGMLVGRPLRRLARTSCSPTRPVTPG